jgi:glycerol-3-phosphate dehydrogenase (NAD(P)+)
VVVEDRLSTLSIGVIGAGAWGTALAQVAARAGHGVTLWARQKSVAEAIAKDGENRARLPGIELDAAIRVTAEAADLAACEIVLIATPAQSLRAVMELFRQHLPNGAAAVVTAKGIERGSLKFMADVLSEVCPQLEPLVLSGPSFAQEVARGLPTAVTLAAPSLERARRVAAALSSPAFRPYTSEDMIGVQVGGAVKNVLAIAAGIVMGRGLGESARAALIARAYAELARFGRALGARTETLAGLSGLGDLVLTCSSAQSRNFCFGLSLGQGESREQASRQARGVSEGVWTAEAVVKIARERGVEVPICEAVHAILEGRLTVEGAIEALMQRPLKSED